MERCSYCGTAYPDSVLECAVDKTPLESAEDRMTEQALSQLEVANQVPANSPAEAPVLKDKWFA